MFALLLPPPPPYPCTFRVQGGREGKVVGVSIRERRRRRVLAHGTVIELGKEVLAKRSDDTPRCSSSLLSSTLGAVATFVRCFLFAFHLSHCIRGGVERTRRVARDKMRLAPRRGEEYPPPLPLSSPKRRRATTRQKRRRPTTTTRAFSLEWRMKVAFRALTRAPIARDTDIRFPRVEGGGKGHLPNSHVVRNASRTGFRFLALSNLSLLFFLSRSTSTKTNVPFFFLLFFVSSDKVSVSDSFFSGG